MKYAMTVALAVSFLSLTVFSQTDQKKTERTVSAKVSVKVTAIDTTSRTLTMKRGDGMEFMAKVSPQVKNLDHVRVGDAVTVTYNVGLAVSLLHTKSAPSEPVTAAGKTKMNATVRELDLKANTVTFVGPKGGSRTVTVKDPVFQETLKTLKIGDVIEITFSDPMVNFVEPAKK